MSSHQRWITAIHKWILPNYMKYLKKGGAKQSIRCTDQNVIILRTKGGFSMKRICLILAVLLCLAMVAGSAQALNIRSWDSNTQRGGDLYNAGTGALQYSSLEAGLTNAGHTILPGISTLTAANLAGVDLFYWGTSSHSLSVSEASVLANFMQGGGCLILEADTATSEYTAANTAFAALGLTAQYTGTAGGSESSNAGTFSNNLTRTTVGPFGDLRGQNFGSTLVVQLDPTGGTVVGSNQYVSMAEFTGFPGLGGLLAFGDPYGFNLENDPTQSFYNPNNLAAILNFAAGQEVVPVPPSVLLFGTGLTLFGMWRRKMRS
jgi:hypothetical protein